MHQCRYAIELSALIVLLLIANRALREAVKFQLGEQPPDPLMLLHFAQKFVQTYVVWPCCALASTVSWLRHWLTHSSLLGWRGWRNMLLQYNLFYPVTYPCRTSMCSSMMLSWSLSPVGTLRSQPQDSPVPLRN